MNSFLPRDTKGHEKNCACACHGFQTGVGLFFAGITVQQVYL